MARLVLLNGAPGVGKSTLALRLAQDLPLTLALDVDTLKHALGQWDCDPHTAGLQARRLALALAAEHLRGGHDVVVGQYLAKVAFIEQLEQLARDLGAAFVDIVLELDAGPLAERLAARTAMPDRPEHRVNARLVAPSDAPALVASVRGLRLERPAAITVDASGDVEQVLARLRTALFG